MKRWFGHYLLKISGVLIKYPRGYRPTVCKTEPKMSNQVQKYTVAVYSWSIAT